MSDILIRHPEKPPQTYRVRDIVWDLDLEGGASMLKQVEVRVQKENSD